MLVSLRADRRTGYRQARAGDRRKVRAPPAGKTRWHVPAAAGRIAGVADFPSPQAVRREVGVAMNAEIDPERRAPARREAGR
jgi:hypothetical protein